MKNSEPELTQLLLRTLEALVRDHEQQQRQQWEQQVATLTGRVQDLQRQLQTLSASLQPLTEQLDAVVALYNSLPKS